MAFLDNFPPKGMNLGVDDGIYWALFQNANSIAVRQEFMVLHGEGIKQDLITPSID